MQRFLALLALGFTIVSCGAPRQDAGISAAKALYAVDPAALDADALQAFIAHAHELAAPNASAGNFTVTELLSGVPMPDDAREAVFSGWPEGLAVSCAAGVCSADGSGQAIAVATDIVMGLIRNPKLVLGSRITFKYVRRGDAAVEMCEIGGVAVRKFFTVPVRGMQLRVEGGVPSAVVDGDQGDAPAYACIP